MRCRAAASWSISSRISLRIDHHARADDGEARRVEDAGRDEVELEGALVGLDRVAGVGAAIGADDDVGVARPGCRSACPCPRRPIGHP